MANINQIIEAASANRVICINIDAKQGRGKSWEIATCVWTLLGFSKANGELVKYEYNLKNEELPSCYAVEEFRISINAPKKFIATTQWIAGKSPATCVVDEMNRLSELKFWATSQKTVVWGDGKVALGDVEYVILPNGQIYILNLQK